MWLGGTATVGFPQTRLGSGPHASVGGGTLYLNVRVLSPSQTHQSDAPLHSL